MATCRKCGFDFAPSDLSPSGLCELCEEDCCEVCGDTLDEFGCCHTCDDDEYDDDEGSCERCGKLLRSHEIEICTECARDIDDGDDAWDYDDEEPDYEICD